jgi:hypothetical protein
MRVVRIALVLSCVPMLTLAQAPQRFETIIQDLRDREFATIKGDFVAAAELMPSDQYSFKVVEGVRSFGEEVAHATAVNFRLCGMAAGTAKPTTTTSVGTDKTSLVGALKSSFALCADTLATATDTSVLARTVGPYIRASHLTAMVSHNNEVYGKLALMLRMKGLVPPSTARQ